MKIAAGRQFFELFRTDAEALSSGLAWAIYEPDGSWSSSPDEIDAAVLVGDAYCDPFKETLLNAPNLAWIHTENSGVDYPFYDQVLARGVTLTRSPGTNAPEVAEFVFATILARYKRLAEFAHSQQQHAWTRLDLEGLSDKTILVVGLGAIGSRVVRIAKAFDMTVLGINRSAESPLEVDALGDTRRLHAFLPDADIVVLALPLTPETEQLIGDRELAMLKQSALLVNVARGGIFDHAALIRVLNERPDLQACLDVFPVEPLPTEDDLWRLPNVLVTPHNAWSSPLYRRRAGHLWLGNLQRYISGQPLQNRVTP